ncbi:hypothetical protein PV325_005797 [Microctonus aethiopoides]|nr:hypothetical protein PV325_005797 [Microctonus aethiopoides]
MDEINSEDSAKNGILDLFKTLREKKEMKKPIPNIHHYHLHYYPLFVHSHYSSSNTINAPNKDELKKVHINQLESVGWTNNKLNQVPEPSVYQSASNNPSIFTTFPNYHYNNWNVNSLDRNSDVESKSGILIRLPRTHPITTEQSTEEQEKDSNPLMKFFEKLAYIKNSMFDFTLDSSTEKIETSDDDLSDFFAYSDPNNI